MFRKMDWFYIPSFLPYMYINDFLITVSIFLMFTDDNSVLIYDYNYNDFTQVFSSVLSHISEWLQANKLVLNM
jgi:hypothetical protein